MVRPFKVPTIDIDSLVRGDGPLRNNVVGKIGAACGDGGIFQVINHGIEKALIDQVQNAQRDFFAAPRTLKRKLMRTMDNARGYFDRELTKNTRDKKEVFDFGFKPQPHLADDHPGNWTVDGYNQWPAWLPEFKQTMMAYFYACQNLALKLTGAICLSLNLPYDRLYPDLADSHTSFIRLNYYPRQDPMADQPTTSVTPLGNLGVHHHSDAGILTLLLQDHVAGLEVFITDQWRVVNPVEGTLLANMGDMMQVFSNDRYNSPLHRVSASTNQERYSVPFFYNPAYETDCYPLETLVDQYFPPRYSKINWGEFRKRRSDGDYANYGPEVQISDYSIV